MQLGCMVQRGHYPISDTRLRGTLTLSSSQDVLDEYEIDEITGLSSKVREQKSVSTYCECALFQRSSEPVLVKDVHVSPSSRIFFPQFPSNESTSRHEISVGVEV